MRRQKLAWLVVLAFTSTGSAQDARPQESFEYDEAHPAAGAWLGHAVRPGAAEGAAPMCHLVISRTPRDGWSVTATVNDTLAIALEAAAIEVNGRDVAFTVPSGMTGLALHLEGTVSEDGQALSGSVMMADDPDGSEADAGTFMLARTPRPLDLPGPLAFKGALTAQGISFDITIVLAQTPGGRWVGQIDVPLQQLRGYPLIDITQEEQTITATVPGPIPGRLEAVLDDQRRTLTGTFAQGLVVLDIALERIDDYEYIDLPRPQHPQPPFPYEERSIVAEHPDGHQLAGTLTLPDPEQFGTGPFAVAVLISGSGQQDRDETLLGHKPFLVIADHLTRHGIAVMRYDDRGVGGSALDDLASVNQATSRDFATDAQAVVERLRTVEKINPAQIGLIGHSEGGIIAPMVARETHVAFIVLLAGPGVPGHELLPTQLEKIWAAGDADPSTVQALSELFRKAIQLSRRDAPGDELRDVLTQMEKLERQSGIDSDGGDVDQAVTAAVQMLTNPWMQFFFEYDPGPDLAALQCPVLALNGMKDLQVWHEQNLDRIEETMRDAGRDVTVKRYPDLNHLFQPCETGLPAEYAEIETTFDPGVLDDLTEWITHKARVQSRKGRTGEGAGERRSEGAKERRSEGAEEWRSEGAEEWRSSGRGPRSPLRLDPALLLRSSAPSPLLL